MPDFRALAKSLERGPFVGAYPWFFLVGINELTKPRPALKTVVARPPTAAESARPPSSARLGVMALPIRKSQTLFPGTITVGRTPNNDIVLEDELVSVYHALFKENGRSMMLGDAGSTNGTFVGGRPLPRNGSLRMLVPGDVVGFARLEFTYLSADDAWEWLRNLD